MDELKSWGELYDPGFKHSGDTHCPYCYQQLNGMGDEGVLPQGYFTFIIGFSIDCPRSGRDNRVGCFIFECLGCFEKYWFHASVQQIKVCKSVGKWPKNNS